MQSSVYDLAIVGSAFGGSLMAMIARRLGYSVVMIERGKHPRFAIGESSTPLTNLQWEELADRYDLPRLRPLSKWGAWQRTYPEIGFGLKRGFSFYHHEFDRVWTAQPGRENELLVAASPNDEIADTHWYRPDFDAFLVREAVSLGVEYWDETNLHSLHLADSRVRMGGVRLGQPFERQARFLIDASGPRGFVWRALRLAETEYDHYPTTQALYSHFRQVDRWEQLHPPTEVPPYPTDDAALHHVFPGGWMWILRFNNGITSAGVSVNQALGRELNLASGDEGWSRLLKRLPSVERQFRTAERIRELTFHEPLTFRTATLAGPGWAMLPSAAGFVDPLLSTGFPLTLAGVERIARVLEKSGIPTEADLQEYSEQTFADLDGVADLVGALHANLGRPRIFQALSMLYFGAVSYAESARRLGRRDSAAGFLLRGRAEFREAVRRFTAEARAGVADPSDFEARVARAIEPINVAGLCQPEKRNWYGVRWSDLVAARDKLAATAAEIEALRARLGVPG